MIAAPLTPSSERLLVVRWTRVVGAGARVDSMRGAFSPAQRSSDSLMQFDEVAGRVLEECLQAGADRRWVADLDASLAQLADGRSEVGDQKCEVLAVTPGGLPGDGGAFLAAGVEPPPADAELRPIAAAVQPQDVDVELEGGVDVVDVDRHVVHGQRLHAAQ